MPTTKPPRKPDTRPACTCCAYPFKHRLRGGACHGPQQGDRPLLTMPGRSHFATDAEYLYESTRPL